jgi:MoaA/NifB/PqqE/SkfB family radical SAM enzyme
LKVTVGSTLTDYTVDNLNELVSFAKNKNISFMWHWFNQSGFYKNKIIPCDPVRAKVALSIMPEGLYKNMWIDSLSGKNPCFNCFALRSFAVLKCNGDIIPCLSKWNQSIGNIMVDSPIKVWQSQKAKTIRQEIANCPGCLNSWGVGWSLQTEYFRVFKEAAKRRLNKF